MKKYYLTNAFALFIAIFLNINNALSQATSAGTNSPSGGSDYLGWASTVNRNLLIKNEDNYSIRFFTNAGAAGTANLRMIIDNGNSAPSGFVGIGTNFTAPTSRLHIRENGNNDAYLQITGQTGNTGETVTDGLRIGVINSSTASLQSVEINQQETAPMNFYTSGTGRMQIYDAASSPTNGGFVGIGNFASFTPKCQLHQYVSASSGSTANVYHQFTNGNTLVTDDGKGFKIGLTYNGTNTTSDAELISQQAGADINFYTSFTGVTKRMTILNTGNVGINTTSGSGRRLEVLDANYPQARLSYSSGVYSDMQTSSTGNLNINPVGSSANVGIGQASPTKKLHVEGDVIVANQKGYYIKANGTDTEILTFKGATNTGLLSVGINAGGTDASADQSVFIGQEAGAASSNTDYSTIVGPYAGHALTGTMTNLWFFGNNSGYSLTSGTENLFVGGSAAYGMTAGNYNTILGGSAGSGVSGGDNNTFVGKGAGANYDGNDNVMIGFDAGVHTGTGAITDRMALGKSADVSCDHCAVLGNLNQHVGIGRTSPRSDSRLSVDIGSFSTYSAYFYGNMYCTGSLTQMSDATVKENVTPLPDVTPIIDALTGYSYNFDTLNYGYAGLPSGTHYGLIAQEVEQVLPGAVQTNTWPEETDANGVFHPAKNVLGLDYSAIIPVLLQAIKQQNIRIDDLEATVTGCCNLRTTGSAPNTGSIDLENVNTLQLLNADPNPFSESTMIRWNIPNDYQNAVVYFYDNSGNQINTYKVNSKGAGELQIFGSSLSSGIYTYSLVVDGKVIDSKKMVKTN
ncbi:MAG: tail fiber domain-containing protein [Bacteroidia bacterium]